MEVYEIGDIDIEEILLYDKNGETVIVDLRGPHREQAKTWKIGSKIKAKLTEAPSRFTPMIVLIFDGEVEVVKA